MGSIEKVNELSSKVLDLQSEVQMYEIQLLKLNDSATPTPSARLEYCIGPSRRSSTSTYLDRDELTSIIARRLERSKKELSEAKRAYENLTSKV